MNIICSLVFDEICLRKQVFWSVEQYECVGYVQNKAFNEDSHDSPFVKQAIVCILNGINVNFEFPIAYYVIDTLNKE